MSVLVLFWISTGLKGTLLFAGGKSARKEPRSGFLKATKPVNDRLEALALHDYAPEDKRKA